MAAPKLVLNRDYVLITVFGRSIEFVKGVPTHVPPICWAAAIGIGAVPEDGSDPDTLPKDKKSDHLVGVDRDKAIEKAILDIVDRNEREDFTAAGSPTVEAMSKALGFKVAGREIATAWNKRNEE